MQFNTVVQDNREPGENPGQSRCCVSGAFFKPKGSHCENGKTKKCDDAKVRRPAFLFEYYETCGVQALIKMLLKRAYLYVISLLVKD